MLSHLGVMYYFGQGVKQILGVTGAQQSVMYENGRGVKQSYEKAMEWYAKAAKQGDAMLSSISVSCIKMAMA